jgi:hypothetical protein
MTDASHDELAYIEASNLAKSIYSQHYREGNEEWRVLPDLRGVISQISNMVAGMTRRGTVGHTAPIEDENDKRLGNVAGGKPERAVASSEHGAGSVAKAGKTKAIKRCSRDLADDGLSYPYPCAVCKNGRCKRCKCGNVGRYVCVCEPVDVAVALEAFCADEVDIRSVAARTIRALLAAAAPSYSDAQSRQAGRSNSLNDSVDVAPQGEPT